jgi:hypothetical protein
MAHRHKVQHAKGGRVVYAGGSSHVAHEAEEKRATGGKVVSKKSAFMAGGKVSQRLDKRARGGGIGANKSPFSTAAHGQTGHGADHGHHGRSK